MEPPSKDESFFFFAAVIVCYKCKNGFEVRIGLARLYYLGSLLGAAGSCLSAYNCDGSLTVVVWLKRDGLRLEDAAAGPRCLAGQVRLGRPLRRGGTGGAPGAGGGPQRGGRAPLAPPARRAPGAAGSGGAESHKSRCTEDVHSTTYSEKNAIVGVGYIWG